VTMLEGEASGPAAGQNAEASVEASASSPHAATTPAEKRRESQEANSQARTNRLAATWPEQATPTRSKSSAPPSREQKVESREQLPPRAASERARTGHHEGVVTDTEELPATLPVAEMTAKGREWLVFRLREVYTAPRLPHVMASEWKPIAHSAEQMKFGVCKFSKIAGVEAKDRERWKKVQTGELKVLAPARPRRPRVPPGPRRLVARPPEVDVQTEPEQQTLALSPKRSPSGHERWKARREPQECPWCGCMEPPTHPKQCKLRMVECKYCKQSMELGSLRLHFKSCPNRPMAQIESRAPKSSTSSAFSTLHRLQSTAAHAARQLEASMRRLLAKLPQASSPEQVTLQMAKLDARLGLIAEELSELRRSDRDAKSMSSRVQDLQKLLYLLQAEVIHVEQMAASWETVLKAGERSKMHCGVSRLQSSVQTIHRQLDELTQQAVEGEMGDPRSNPDYAPAHLEATLEAIKEEGTASDRSQQTLIAQGAAPNIEVMSVLQGRLHFFQELLRCVTEAVAKNDHASTLQSIVRHRPQNSKRAGLPALSARQSPELVEEPPQMPPPVEQVRADLCESSPLPPDRGPAAMGRREMSLAQMREEVDEERKRYIAYHLVRDEHRGPASLSTAQASFF